MPNILDLPLAKRPIKLDDYNIDLDAAVEVDIVWGDYVMDIRAANVVLAKFYDSEIEEYFSGREKAIYRNYYKLAKSELLEYKNREAPDWVLV